MPLTARALPGPLWASRLRVGLEVALVVALGVQAARLAWIFLAPESSSSPPPPSFAGPRGGDPAVLTRINPFEGAPDAGANEIQAPVSSETATLALFGVRTLGPGAPTAILGAPGGPQQAYAVGDEVAPGVVLSEVRADHVMLSRAGTVSRLDLNAGSPGAPVAFAPFPAVAAASSRPPTAAAAVEPSRFLAEAGLTPRMEEGQLVGYAVVPRGGPLLGQLGLAAGDVIVAVNGERLTAERYSGLAEQLMDARAAQLTVQRGSQTRTVTLQSAR